MKWILLVLAVLMMAVSPAFCEDDDFDIEEAMEHLELQHEQAEFEFEQDMREIELEERRLEVEHRRMEMERGPDHRKKKKDEEGVFCLIIGIVHILMAVWVYQDVRKKNNGNGIWIIITLLAGFFGAAVYAFIRLGDSSQKEK